MNASVKKSLREALIFVGLSGGVDSAVSAALLKEQGARVVGVFIKGWYPPGLRCTWADDRRDAMRVAAHLGIPFVTLDASEEYKHGVIDYLLREYRAGRTPNPDIMCNREVKFGAFYRFAKEHGADYVATGHYATTDDEGRLKRGSDTSKDQSYFLWAIPKDALAHTLFPVGNMPKAETRALAKRYALPVARKKDSQGICFLGSVSVEEFLTNEFGSAPGIARDETGNVVGTHSGVLLHTLGERISLTQAPPGPWYVVRKDIPANELIVSKERAATERREGLELTESNWLSDKPGEDEQVEAQYRYHGPSIRGRMVSTSFIPEKPLPEPVAQGQSLVIYRGNECVGGGIIA